MCTGQVSHTNTHLGQTQHLNPPDVFLGGGGGYWTMEENEPMGKGCTQRVFALSQLHIQRITDYSLGQSVKLDEL